MRAKNCRKNAIIIHFKLLFLKLLDEYMYFFNTRFSCDDASSGVRRKILTGNHNLPKILEKKVTDVIFVLVLPYG